MQLLSFLIELFDAIHKDDEGVLVDFLDELMSHPLDHNMLAILIKLAAQCDWFVKLLAKSLGKRVSHHSCICLFFFGYG